MRPLQWMTAALPLSSIASAQGLFKPDQDALQWHLHLRDKMMQSEQNERQDHAFRASLSPVCSKADRLVKQIRQDEIDDYWRVYSTIDDPQKERFAGEMFPRAKEYIARTKLWKIVQNVPKGALLHAHLSAMLPYETILQTLINTPGMVVSTDMSVATPLDQQRSIISFVHVNHAVPESNPSINDVDYVPNTQIPIKVAVGKWPGGESGFIDFVKSKATVTPVESVHHELGVDEVWRKFQSSFGVSDTMLNYEPIVRAFYKNLFSRLVEDKINWVEIRASGFAGQLVRAGDEAPDPSLDLWWDVLLDELEKFKASPQGKNFWGARVIWADLRSLNTANLTSSMKIALDRKQKFPELFSGYDVVAQEDLGRTLLDLAPELIWFQQQAKQRNLTVPFFFHAGETLGDWNSTDLNLFDAVAFQTRRIGHGFSLYKHPQLIQQVVDKNIMVEVCPISNEVLRLATDILHHPLPAMIAHGVPTAISNDDPAVLGQDIAGVSYDFYQTIQGLDSIGLAGLGALAQNSIRWSNFEDQDDEAWIRDIELGVNGTGIKALRLKQWNADWEKFCQWTIEEYGS